MHVPQLRSTKHDQETKGLAFTACPSTGRNLVSLITREGINLVEIPPKSQHSILLRSLMWAHLSVMALG